MLQAQFTCEKFNFFPKDFFQLNFRKASKVHLFYTAFFPTGHWFSRVLCLLGKHCGSRVEETEGREQDKRIEDTEERNGKQKSEDDEESSERSCRHAVRGPGCRQRSPQGL